MRCSEILERIDDWLEGTLPEKARAGIEAHLSSCDACRLAFGEQRALLDSVAVLPREITPPRNLFPAIRRAIEARIPGPSTGAGAVRWTRARVLAIAAGVAIAWIAGTWALRLSTGWNLREASPAPGVADRASRDDRGTDARAEEGELRNATAAIVASLDGRERPIVPEARAAILGSITIVDGAIDEIRACLTTGPLDPERELLLASLFHRKTWLLGRAARLSRQLG